MDNGLNYKLFEITCRYMVDYLNSEQKRYNDVVLNKQDINVGRLLEIDEEIEQVLIVVNKQGFLIQYGYR